MATKASSFSIWKSCSFLWVTLALFLGSLAGHWIFGWFAYIHDQEAHQQSVKVSEFACRRCGTTLENWQSELLQLIWQVAGLAFLLHIGSPQSEKATSARKKSWIAS